jgi:predicted nucleic acid-binding protein
MSSQSSTPLPIVVDASVWVARFVPPDRFHAASTAWLGAQLNARRTLVSPSLLLVEVAGSVSRVLNDTQLGLAAARTLTRLSVVHLVPLDSILANRAFRLAATARLRGADAIYAALSHHLGLQLVSWDGEQIARAGAITP